MITGIFGFLCCSLLLRGLKKKIYFFLFKYEESGAYYLPIFIKEPSISGLIPVKFFSPRCCFALFKMSSALVRCPSDLGWSASEA
ncbi:hypothetical protein L873DRAFT_1758574 [Choiromyces venosus 120613-1]|uniref:Uncharacterized protein n=1 Tax=Choiromyces venosus 120613-1 TaxID=1336337 RepID=A0A3N4K8U6_9PEZI|nr:hypothetical protein L873DRAFT_1758574 [Choiromyces venosus 120613-1]